MSDTRSPDDSWLPPVELPPTPEPSSTPPKKTASGWLIPAAIVAAGVLIAIAVLMSRSRSEDVTTSALEPNPVEQTAVAPSGPPAPAIPPSPVDTAGDALAQENLQSVVGTARNIYDSSGSYLAATSFDMATQLPDLTFVDPITESTSASEISISTATTTFSAAAKSDSGTCWWMRAVADKITYGTGASCTGTSAAGAQAAGWPSPSPGSPIGSPTGSPTPSASP